jgi:hypothetical protein
MQNPVNIAFTGFFVLPGCEIALHLDWFNIRCRNNNANKFNMLIFIHNSRIIQIH